VGAGLVREHHRGCKADTSVRWMWGGQSANLSQDVEMGPGARIGDGDLAPVIGTKRAWTYGEQARGVENVIIETTCRRRGAGGRGGREGRRGRRSRWEA